MFQFGKNLVGRYPSPSLPLSKAATGAGFAKLDCKILSPKGLEVKILRTNDLGCLPAILSVPLSLCNHLLFKFFAQGQMSKGLWKSGPPAQLFCQEELFGFQSSQSSIQRRHRSR